MRLQIILLGFLLMLSLQLFSQTIDYEYYKDTYPDASHVVLEKKVKITYLYDKKTKKIRAKSTHHLKILGLEDACRNLELVQIPFSKFEKVKLRSAKYFILDSLNQRDLVENVKVRYAEEKNYFINNIFYSDLKVKQFGCSLPVREKMVLHYSYEIIYNDLKFLTRFGAQNGREVVEKYDLSITIPEFVEAEIVPFNMEVKPTVSGLTTTYHLENLEPPVKNILTPPSNYYAPHFVVVTKSYKEGKNTINILNSVDDLYKWYNSLIRELQPDKTYIKELANSITAKATDEEEQIEAIFKWVQDNINYVAYEDGIAGFKPDEAQNVYKLKYGDCKGMANLTVELLRAKGFKAYHTWIGTRHLNYDYTLPSLVVDNHMICALKYQEKTFFLDATSNQSSWKISPYHLQGKEALVGQGEKYELKTIDISASEANVWDMNGKVTVDANYQATFDGNITVTGEYATMFDGVLKNRSNYEKDFINEKLLSVYIPEIDFAKGKIAQKTSNKLVYKATGKPLGHLLPAGNEAFLFCDMDQVYYDFNAKEQNIPLYINFKKEHHSTINYILPSSNLTLPKNVSFSSKTGLFSFEIKYTQSGNQLKYEKKMVVNTLLVAPEYFEEWDEFIDQLSEAYQSPVRISK